MDAKELAAIERYVRAATPLGERGATQLDVVCGMALKLIARVRELEAELTTPSKPGEPEPAR